VTHTNVHTDNFIIFLVIYPLKFCKYICNDFISTHMQTGCLPDLKFYKTITYIQYVKACAISFALCYSTHKDGQNPQLLSFLPSITRTFYVVFWPRDWKNMHFNEFSCIFCKKYEQLDRTSSYICDGRPKFPMYTNLTIFVFFRSFITFLH
jgi:hypothetical protein